MCRLWVEAGFNPDSFWRQTERSFCIALAGAAARLEREVTYQKLMAWNVAALSGAASVGKLRPFAECFPPDDEPEEVEPVEPGAVDAQSAAILSAMFRLKAAGVPVQIRRIDPHKLN